MLNVQQVVQRKAYFVFLNRQSHGLGGNSQSDWLVAQNLLGLCWHQVRIVASEIYFSRRQANTPGSPMGDWLEAERTILAGQRIYS